MEEDEVLDQIIVTTSLCEIKLQFIERVKPTYTVYVVSFQIGTDQPKETISRDRVYIEELFVHTQTVIV